MSNSLSYVAALVVTVVWALLLGILAKWLGFDANGLMIGSLAFLYFQSELSRVFVK